MLHKWYRDPHKILAAYRKEIMEWPSVKQGDAAGFGKFLNFFEKCCSLMSENKMGILINNPDVICKLLPKLSGYLQNRWNRKV